MRKNDVNHLNPGDSMIASLRKIGDTAVHKTAKWCNQPAHNDRPVRRDTTRTRAEESVPDRRSGSVRVALGDCIPKGMVNMQHLIHHHMRGNNLHALQNSSGAFLLSIFRQ